MGKASRKAQCAGCQHTASLIAEFAASVETAIAEATELVADARRLVGHEPWEPVILTNTDEPALIAVTPYDRYRPLLACGHWGQAVAPDSSLWSSPMDTEDCFECRDDRYLDTRLQSRLLNYDGVPAGYEGER